ILIGLGAFVGVVVIATMLLVAFFPKDAAIAEAIRRIDAATGRHLTVRGNVQLSLWPTLGVSAEGASLSNPQGFGDTPFLSADRIVVGVSMWPLLHGEVHVTEARFDGAQLNLQAKADGSNNWTFPTQPTPEHKTTLGDLKLDNVRLTRGRISFEGGDA